MHLINLNYFAMSIFIHSHDYTSLVLKLDMALCVPDYSILEDNKPCTLSLLSYNEKTQAK